MEESERGDKELKDEERREEQYGMEDAGEGEN